MFDHNGCTEHAHGTFTLHQDWGKSFTSSTLSNNGVHTLSNVACLLYNIPLM